MEDKEDAPIHTWNMPDNDAVPDEPLNAAYLRGLDTQYAGSASGMLGFAAGAHAWRRQELRERMLELAIRGCPSADSKRLVADAARLERYVLGESDPKTEE